MTNYECTKEKECPTCQKQGIKASSDPDSSDQAWEYYKHVYKDEYGKYDKRLEFLNKLNVDGENDKKYQLKGESNRLIAETIDRKIPIPDFGGDTMFNFKHIKYNFFQNVLDTDTAQLDRCAKNHHSLLNFSLMPSTGGLNDSKGRIFDKLDRFDTFIYFLDQFYNSSTQHIYTHALLNGSNRNVSFGNIKILKDYLQSYDTVDNYCKKIYFISDDNFIDRLIANGRKPIHYFKLVLETLSEPEKQDNIETLKEYMDLAEDYWEMRHNQIQKNLCNSCKQGNCNCDSNKYYYTDRHGDSKSYCYHDNCKPEISI